MAQMALDTNSILYPYWLGKTYVAHFNAQPLVNWKRIDYTYFVKGKQLFEQLAQNDTTAFKPYLAIAELYFDKIKLILQSFNFSISKEDQDKYVEAAEAVEQEIPKALVYAKKAEQRHPDYIPTLRLLCEIYACLNDFDTVKRYMKRIEILEKK